MTAVDDARFGPNSPGPTALFLDTSGLFARFHPDAAEHDQVRGFFDAIASGQFPYRPLVTNTYVVDELATLLVTRGSHDHAATALEALTDSETISIRSEDGELFQSARDAFLAYDDHEISFTDHYCAVEMNARSIDHVLAFDGDYESLGFTVLPRK